MQSRLKINCLFGNSSTNLCVSLNCLHQPFTCSDEDCSCHQNHLQCPQQFQTQLFMANLNSLSNMNKQSLSAIVQCYDELIKILIINKQQIEQKIENMEIQGGMESDEYQILKSIRSHQLIKLTGRDVEKIITRWEERKKKKPKKFQNYERIINNEIKRIRNQIELLFVELKQVVSNTDGNKLRTSMRQIQVIKKPSCRDILSRIRECKVREIKIDDEQIDRGSEITELNKITSLSLQFITPSVIELLEQNCPRLKRLLIQSEVTDTVCSSLAKSMKTLQHLIIIRSSITDTGGAELAGSLQNLSLLEINHSNITDSGRKLIRKLFPKSKVLKI